MRMPTENEQQELRNIHAKLREDLAKAAPVMAAHMNTLLLAFRALRDAMANALMKQRT